MNARPRCARQAFDWRDAGAAAGKTEREYRRRESAQAGQRVALELVVEWPRTVTEHRLFAPPAEQARARVGLPLWVSHEALLDAEGPLGGGWRPPAAHRRSPSAHGQCVVRHGAQCGVASRFRR